MNVLVEIWNDKYQTLYGLYQVWIFGLLFCLLGFSVLMYGIIYERGYQKIITFGIFDTLG